MTTPLILAIEPDRVKASQLRSIARQVNAELLLTDSVDGALTVLGEQMPDLILTPALLSARDDLALTGRLRELGDAAAHIQTLTSPTLQAAEPPSFGAGMFATLRRDRPHMAGPDACEADTFAEQVALYLKGAAEARRRHSRSSVGAGVPATVALGESQPANDDESPVLAEFDLSAFISEGLLDPVPIPACSEPPAASDLPPARPQVDAAISKALSDVLSEDIMHFMPEDLSGMVSKGASVSPEALPGFVPEGSDVTSEEAPACDNWHFFDPEQSRFAALLVRLDEITAS